MTYNKHTEHIKLLEELFEKYPNLPPNWEFDTQYMRLGYCWIDGEGLEEMATIAREFEVGPRVIAGSILLIKNVQVVDKWVEIRGQMEIVDEPRQVSRSAEERAIEALKRAI